jgi:type IV fimbrial biogenesis protein FimT
MSRRQVAGFTLLELMVTIAIMAVLIAIAVPSFQGSLRSNRVATTSNELLASLSLARSEGIKSTRGGGVCASANGSSCGADWSQGWMVWTEKDGDGVYDNDETVVRYSQGKPRLQVAGSAATVAFDGRGRIMGGAAATIGVVPEGVTTPARCVDITITGQARVKHGACS